MTEPPRRSVRLCLCGLLLLAGFTGCSSVPASQGQSGYRDGLSEASPFSWGPISASSLRDAQQDDFDNAIPR
ncbi:hypothetical protein [Gluconobacter sphaericus]|uniref:Lipoprotein n=1 Tax=Gluconobacter sphaericus NBRC 12467 TaxID=1307951 RepID=A0AA37SI59_9PROT|nr:hypothetical protein [Gluconobacter sphaericus]MBF0884899.1 hypothetical protein [Gluconobacter sphaericus]MBS1096621.1 hypothetical protein [Gluconobacter sphaericus]QQX91894.1 hypothetical protein IGS75_04765 [Gluconobacter sphaericus]GEB41699.1 hypothetical protein GSP01_04810 [Gluconobacter sphaericus NBRC 12467]GLQ84345.1 hypothetical protein GCM10007872_12530 [Gluconobacter sphaericus NBRC 12467]